MNYILQYKWPRRPTSEEVDQVRSVDGVHIIDESAFSLLVKVTPAAFRKLPKLLPDWELAPEVIYAPPDTKERVDKED